MNLDLTRRVLSIVESQPFGFVKLRCRRLAPEVREMEKAGLIELSRADHDDEDVVIIKSMTEKGRTFLRLFRSRDMATTARDAFNFDPNTAIDLEVSLL